MEDFDIHDFKAKQKWLKANGFDSLAKFFRIVRQKKNEEEKALAHN